MAAAATDSGCSCGVAAVAIADAAPGQTGAICHTALDEHDAAMLRAMGLRPNSIVRICRVGEPCIVEVLGVNGCACRIGLSRPLARRVKIAGVCAA